MLRDMNKGDDYRSSRLDDALIEYHLAGARLFRLLYWIIIVQLIFFVIVLVFGCFASLSSFALFVNLLQSLSQIR